MARSKAFGREMSKVTRSSADMSGFQPPIEDFLPLLFSLHPEQSDSGKQLLLPTSQGEKRIKNNNI